ncbi:MAG: VWA domain-containing protein [Thermoflexibacter sp.]|nr:VWA domain-containing protein [Thermoflexibacter sp.]
MQKLYFLIIFLLLPIYTQAQMTRETQKSLNNQVDFITQSTKDLQGMVKSFYNFYQSLNNTKNSKRKAWLTYQCPHELDTYYYEQAQTKSGNIGNQLKAQSTNLRECLERIDEKCKAIEVYVRLKDYEKDNLEKGFLLINEIQPLVSNFNKVKAEYESSISSLHQKLRGTISSSAYAQCEKNMRFVLEKDKELINSLTFNFNSEIHTNWAKDEIQKNINAIDVFLEEIQKNPPKISYPASSYYASFWECVQDFQKHKKYTIDKYNFDAQKSDEHANNAYWGFINYYDGCLVSFFNLFTDFAQNANVFVLKSSQIAPTFQLKTQKEEVNVKSKFFQDIPYQSLEIKSQNSAITSNLNNALNKYIEFINEGVRVSNNLLRSLINSNVSLNNFEYETSFYFHDNSFQMPQSLYQETVLANKNIPASAQKSLALQTEVLYNILKEMNELSQEIYIFAENKTFKTQGFKRIEEIRDRYKILYETFDNYKERLFTDLRKIFDSYKFADPQNSWVKSYLALSEVVQDDKDLLLNAKKYYRGDDLSPTFNKEKLNNSIRSAIANEFTNMKGIERIGRNNGLCPYNPYQDIGTESQHFIEYPEKLRSKKYEDFIYKYNAIVREKNRFVEVAKVPLLKEIDQLGIFFLKEPYKREKKIQEPKEEVKTKEPSKIPTENKTTDVPKVITKTEKIDTVKVEVIKKETVIVKETVIRDTVYIRDTIYLEKPPVISKDFYSLEGYAPNNLVLLLDVSSSMNSPERLPLLQTSIKKLVSLFRQEDNIAIVIYSGNAQVILPSTSGKDKDKIIKAIESLEPRGKTDANAGLSLAYKIANQKFKYGGNNRIVLATDGEFGVRPGVMDLIGQNANMGIVLTIFKFGEKPTPNLKQISDKGKGNLVSINPQNAEAFMINEAKVKK